MQRKTACLVLVSCTVLFSSSALAAESPSADEPARWRLGLGVGVLRVDHLAGTPLVPSLTAGRAFGGSGAGAFDVTLIRGAGRYGLDALVFDLGFGLRKSGEIAEVSFLVGPTAMVGGDGDGTPYLAAGAQAALTGTLWITETIGFSARGAARFWLLAVNEPFAPSLTAGLMLRL